MLNFKIIQGKNGFLQYFLHRRVCFLSNQSCNFTLVCLSQQGFSAIPVEEDQLVCYYCVCHLVSPQGAKQFPVKVKIQSCCSKNYVI